MRTVRVAFLLLISLIGVSNAFGAWGRAEGVTPEQLKTNVAERNVGKEYRVLLPIEIGGQIVDYTLIFRVTATDAYSVTLLEFEKLLFPFERSSL